MLCSGGFLGLEDLANFCMRFIGLQGGKTKSKSELDP